MIRLMTYSPHMKSNLQLKKITQFTKHLEI